MPYESSKQFAAAHKLSNNPRVLNQTVRKSILVAYLVSAASAASNEDWRMERFESRHAAGDIDAVRMTNLHGDIRVRTTGEDLIEVTAIIQSGAQVPSPQVLVDYDTRPVTIEVSIAAPQAPENLQRVDLAVSLPGHIEVVSQTDNGLLELKGRTAMVDARSTTGRIYVSTDAPVRVQNTHGSVEIVFSGTPAGSVETRTGDITTWLPRRAATIVEARTQAAITTDFTVTIDIDEEGFRNGVARIGRGRSILILDSTRGAVHLLRPGR